MAVLPPDPVFCFKSDMENVLTLHFPDAGTQETTTKLLAGSTNGFVYFWNLETNRLDSKQKMGQCIQSIHTDPSSNLIIQDKFGTIKLWTANESDYRLQSTYQSSENMCKCLLLSVDNVLVVPQSDSTIDIVNLRDFKQINTLTPNKSQLGQIMCLQNVLLDGKQYILGGYESGDIILWDLSTGQTCSNLKLMEFITSLTFDTLSGRGICSNASNRLQIFTIASRNFDIQLKCELTMSADGCNVVKLRENDRKIFVAGGWDGGIRLYSWKSLRLLAVLTEHRGAVQDVQFTRKPVEYWNNYLIAAAAADGMISLWNLYN